LVNFEMSMIKSFSYFYRVISFFTFLFLLLIALPGKSQTEVLLALKTNFETYNSKFLQEKMYVHTDKRLYMAGEILWFKTYLVDALSHKPLALSKVAYIEVLDKENKPVAQAKIALNNGAGNGSFHFPLTLSSGNYKLRAYTNWMKNFDARLFFEKVITIINPLKAPPVAAYKATVNYNVDFFPEGGNLVRGIPCKVGFKISDQFGRGVNGKGAVVNGNDDTVAVFQTLKSGIGSFDFISISDQVYKAIIQLPDGGTITRSLPEMQDSGYVMRFDNTESDHITVTVSTNNKEDYKDIFLLARTREQITFAERSTLKDGKAVFVIDKNKLPEGVNQLTVFNNDKQTLSERLYFKRPSQKLAVEAVTDKEMYSSRQQVKISFSAKDTTSLPANISLAVYRTDQVQKMDETDIASDLWLKSDLFGFIESPSYYLSGVDEEVERATENLMLVQRWNGVQWKDILNEANPLHKFSIEYNGQIVTARITDTRTGGAGKKVSAFLSIPGSKHKLYTAQSDTAGIVQFEVKDYYGAGEIVPQIYNGIDSSYSISLLSPFAEKYSDYPVPEFSLSGNAVDSLLEDYSIGMQVQNVYASDKVRNFIMPELKDTFPFFGRPAYTYVLDDYRRFTTMEEVLREYVREINVGVRNGKLFMKLLNEDRREFSDDNILVLLNGIPLKNINEIFYYDPLKFKTLDIIPRPYILGSSSFVGLVNFSTYGGELQDLDLDPHLIAVDFDGLQLQREFYVPAYQSPEQLKSRTPDFRNTLFWNSTISVNPNELTTLNFYTCDQKGNYVILWQGINSNGKIVTGQLPFQVK